MSATPNWIVLTALSKFFTVAEASGITELGFKEEVGDGETLHIRIEEEPGMDCAYTVYMDGVKYAQIALNVAYFEPEPETEEADAEPVAEKPTASTGVKVKTEAGEDAKKDSDKKKEVKADPPSKKDKEPLGKKSTG